MEQNYLVEQFIENFESSKEIKTAIYGISISTKIVLDGISGYAIVGLLDGIVSQGEMYGYPIIPLETLPELGVRRIIIVARAASVKIVFNRIRKFASDNGIEVYDVNGNDLAEKYKYTGMINGFYGEEAQLKEIIDQSDAVSFDIFDTILMRKVLYPTDIFELVERRVCKASRVSFKEQRRRAELDLVYAGKYPTYDEIYDLLAARLSVETPFIEELKKAEYELERMNLCAREKVVDLYRYALERGKKIYFVSDMYYTATDMKLFLEDVGINEYEEVIVSSDWGVMKSGGLFEVLKNRLGKRKCVHIGDNEEADVVGAVNAGLTAVKIMSAYEMLEKSSYSNILKHQDAIENRVAMGLLISKAFNDPFCMTGKDGRLTVNNCEDFSFFFVAPYIMTYMEWLYENTSNSDFDKILFMARDGYLLEKLYKKYYQYRQGAIESKYFYISRFPAAMMGIYEEKDIINAIASGYDGNPEDMLKKRFYLSDDKISHISENESREEYLIRHKDAIICEAEKIRESYNKYLLREDIASDKKLAVMDLAASGSCQKALQEVVSGIIQGFYFVHIVDEKKRDINIRSLYSITNWFKKDAAICEYYVLLENILTSYEGTFFRFDSEGSPLFVEEKRTKREFDNLERMQNSIEAFCEAYKGLLPEKACTKEYADEMLSYIQYEKTDISLTGIDSSVLEDDFFNRKYSMKEIIL